MKKHESRGRQTTTKVELERSQHGFGGEAGLSKTLTPLEEKVIRMLHGLGEDDSKELEFAVGASEDARMRLALMEACNVASALEAGEDVPLDRGASDTGPVLQAITQRFAAYGE